MFDQNIVIIGGGIGGLCSALFLKRQGHNVHVYERAEEILPVGAAISVWSNGVKVLNRLGLGKKAKALGGQMDYMIYRDLDDTVSVSMDLNKGVYDIVGERGYPIARGELQQMLMDQYIEEGGNLTLGRTCVGVEHDGTEDGPCRVRFDDGSASMYCDILIGADGLRSKVREFVLEKETPLVYHYTNWNGLVEMTPELGPKNEWTMWVGDGCRASLMPVARNRFYFFMGSPLTEDAMQNPPPRGEAMRDELKKVFGKFPERIQALIRNIDVQNSLNRIPICDHDPLPKFSRGRVVLLGDSLHGTTPTLGQGGCQAMEDSEVLASFLGTTNIGIADVFRRYEQHRKHRVHDMVNKARERTRTIYPPARLQGREADEAWAATRQWYQDLKDPSIGPKIMNGIATNIQDGPWPPRL